MEKKKFNKKWLLLLLIPAFFGTMLTIRHFTGICPCKVVLNKIVSTITGKTCNTCKDSGEMKKKAEKVQEIVNDADSVQTFEVSHGESDKKDWTSGKLIIGDKTYTYPFSIEQFEKDGYTLSEIAHMDILKQGEVANYDVSKDPTYLSVTTRNNSETDKKPKECDVYIVSVSKTDQVLSDGLSIGDSVDKAIETLGQPNTIQGSDGNELLMYLSPETGFNLTLIFVDDALFSYQYIMDGVQDVEQVPPPVDSQNSNEENNN